ncbi:MAG: FGGY family carbohydrate kinase [Eubacteriales bacterium]
MSKFLAIDLGTTGCRSIVFDQELHILGDSYEEYGLIIPQENWVEQDADLWWNLTVKTMKEAIHASGISGREIVGISISSQGITVVPVNKSMQPLCNAISWLDIRAQEETEQIIQDFGQQGMFAITGKRIDACYTLPKILWLKKNKPDIFAKTWKLLMPMEYLIGKLTGECVSDHSMASGTLMYDIKQSRWSSEILSNYGLTEQILPELKWSGERAGTVLPSVAEEIGLREDCIVAVGAQDQKCASLGAGLRPGVITISLGTSGAVCKVWDTCKTQGAATIGWSAYINKKSWVTEGVVNTAGVCLRWLRDTLFADENYDAINEKASVALAKGSGLMFFPYMNGPSCPTYQPESQGCFYGINLGTEKGEFALAVMEGVAFQFRSLLETMDAYGSVHALVLFGGGVKSDLWCRIIADVTGLKVNVLETTEAAGAGAAICAGIATGDFNRNRTPEIATARQYEPCEYGTAYREKYQKYRIMERRMWPQKEESL